MLIEGGDRLTINSAGSFARNYTVEGNEESSLLREFNLAYVEGAEKLNDIAAAYARNGQSEEELKRLAKAYSDEYPAHQACAARIHRRTQGVDRGGLCAFAAPAR